MPDTAIGDLIARLGTVRQELVGEVSPLETKHLGARAKPGEWHVAQILRHMVYAERRYLTSIAAIRAVLNLGADAAAELEELVAGWLFTRETLLHELSRVKPDQLDLRTPGSDRTIREWVEMAINHDRSHTVQLREILSSQKKG